MESLYPAGPQATPSHLTTPTSAYKRQAWIAMIALLGFALVYFSLAGWFAWTSYRLGMLIYHAPHSAGLTAMAGAAFSAFLALFMFKAVFFIRKGNAPDDVEITAAEQPQLFSFLNRLADDAGAPRASRVYLSARVNAAVFYDLSILNFFFPSKKNLEIGLPLVNTLTLSELKAVLAHEFGHFAQRSMAIGSWIYIAQQVAAHIIAKRDALDKFLKFISNIDLRIAWVGWLLSLIVWSIRSLTDSLFRLVMLAQRALSRQMEFQADLVAVSLTGSDELIHALHKLQSADDAWSRTLAFADAEAEKGRAIKDIFDIQTRIIHKTAHILADENYGKSPTPDSITHETRLFSKGFARPPQMWSTHPANADREENAKRLYVSAAHDARPAWVIFQNESELRETFTARLFTNTDVPVATTEETLKALDSRYNLQQYDPIYRGAYLGRAFTRSFSTASEVFGSDLNPQSDVREVLGQLYPEALRDELSALDKLVEEQYLLEALRNRVFQSTGEQILFRGAAITRRELPKIILDVAREISDVRQRLVDHDRRCRAAHLAAARTLKDGWPEYLQWLVSVLHYAEHTLADLQDSYGLLNNVAAIVTADGKVSAKELRRLLATANQLFGTMEQIHKQKDTIQLDIPLLARLHTESWSAMLEEFKLPPAHESNINDWMRVIPGWVGALSSCLSRLQTETLEQLLESELQIQEMLNGKELSAAPATGMLPATYEVLPFGTERKRQNKLDAWSRFQTADGLLAGTARLLVAVTIVGGALLFGMTTGSSANIRIYNGLASPVSVNINGQTTDIGPGQHGVLQASNDEPLVIRTFTGDHQLIESFQPASDINYTDFVYNVASSGLIAKLTASYGNADEVKPVVYGAERWIPVEADYYFEEPPERIDSKSGGGTRSSIMGYNDPTPLDMLRNAGSEENGRRMLQAHASWDGNSANSGTWQRLQQELSEKQL